MLKIGNIELKYPIFLAPLSGYSDRAMRAVTRLCGAELTFAGLMLDKSACHPKVIRKISYQPGEDEHPVGAQIHGVCPDTMANAGYMLQKAGYDIIDLNFACPARKVLAGGRGGYLMNNPRAVNEITKSVRSKVSVPLMMKIRIGYENDECSRECFWQICEDASQNGVDALTIHGRYVMQKYRGVADWELISQVKDKYPKMTIIGSGDLFEPYDCIEKMNKSGVDGISIARGAIGNPWVFQQLKAVIDEKPLPKLPSLSEQSKIVKMHIEMIMQLYVERKTTGYFRKFAAKYCLLHPEKKSAAKEMLKCETLDELYASINKWYSDR